MASILSTIQLETTSTSGTLTSEQLATLQESKTNYIVYGTELFKLVDNNTSGDTLIYTCSTNDSGILKVKSITITISTLAWAYSELSSGSGKISNKLYLHSIIMTSANNNKITTILINSSSNQFNVSSLNDWLISNGFIVQNMPADDNSNMYLASGSQGGMIVNGIYSYASNELYCNCSLKDDNGLNNSNISLNNYNFIDTVIQIL